MPARKRVKKSNQQSKFVAVIASADDLRAARRLSSAPDFFELRLDCLVGESNLERKARGLSAPLIVTARHPAEGGKNNLSAKARRDLLLQFLPLAKYVDIELRSAGVNRPVLDSARRNGVSTIISFHDFGNTPTSGSLRAKATRAAAFRPALFKIATRTDTATQLGRLLQFVSTKPETLAVSVMGMGKLGAISRLILAQCGSVLTYTSVGEPRIPGQLSLAGFQAALRELDAPI